LATLNSYILFLHSQHSIFVDNLLHIRDDHSPFCCLDIRQDSEFATGYGYPKTAFKREPDTDPDIRDRAQSVTTHSDTVVQ